jgi:pSer/pThr/pTyr-binding forkhead associated (FHA) protein
MPKLVCTHGNNAEETFAIKEGVNRVGRSPDTVIKLYDKACSRAHAEIYRKGDNISVEDLGSRHGTFVNGKRITHRVKLHVGDRVDIGHTVLKLSPGEGTGAGVKPALPVAGTPGPEAQTQEMTAHLLAAELDLGKPGQPPPKTNVFRRFFSGGNDEAGSAEGGADPKGGTPE